ncbi:MAG: hypothetical protein ABW185_30235 [Sedimenticola sp.]
MNSQTIYVPNIQKWIRYYGAVAKKTHNSYADAISSGVNQRGGSISGTTNNFMVPIDEHAASDTDRPEVKVEMVSPAQQDTERARSEMKRSNITTIRKRRNKKKKVKQNIIRDKIRGRSKSTGKAAKKIKKNKRKSKKKAVRKNKKKVKTVKKIVSDIFT